MVRRFVLGIVIGLFLLAAFQSQGASPRTLPAAQQGALQITTYTYYGIVRRTGTTAGIAGATVTLYAGNPPYPLVFVASQVTGSNGSFSLSYVAETWSGWEWSVVETNPTGFTSTGSEIIGCRGDMENYYCYAYGNDADRAWGFSKYGGSPTAIYFYDTTPLRIVGALPSSGSSCANTIQQFTTTVADDQGFTDISAVEYLFDTGAWMADAVYLKYSRSQNLIYLRNDGNTQWLGGYAPGSGQTIQNSRVRVHVGQCSVATSPDGRRLSVTWALEFFPAFAGHYDQYLYAVNVAGAYEGWNDVGDWTVTDCTITPGAPTATPTATTVPTAGTVTFQQGLAGYTGSHDVGINSWYPNDNYEGGQNDSLVIRANDSFAGLLRFDVSSIPANATVTAATLSIYAFDWHELASLSRPLTVGAYEVYRQWVASEATWNRAAAGQSWGAPGCNNTTTDRAAQPESSAYIDAVLRWYDLDVSDMVQKWVRTVGQNHGLILKAFGASAGVSIVTAEHGGTWMRPKLTISYVLPTPTPTTTSTQTPTPTKTVTSCPTPTPTATQPTTVQQRIPLHVGWNWFSFNIVPTVGSGGDCSGLNTTPYFTHYYGYILLDGQPAPAGTRVEMYSPRGERVGCSITMVAGLYSYTRVYGEDSGAGIPGMRAGEAVTFRVNGALAATDPVRVTWADDKGNHAVDLTAFSQVDVATVLASIAGRYSLVLGEEGTYAPPPADPRFNTLTSLQPGATYLIRMTQVGELVLNGTRVAANTPISLHQGWNWPGYLPDGGLAVATALASITGKYNLLLSEDGTYAPPPADPRFNTLTQMAPGEGYMLRMTQAGTLIYPGTTAGRSTVR